MTVQLDRPARRSHAGPPATADHVGPAQRLSRLDTRSSPYLYIAPFFLLFAIFGAYPLAYTAWVSLHDWDLLGRRAPVRRAGELHRAARRRRLLERGGQHAGHLRHLDGAAAARRALAGQPAQPAAAGPDRLCRMAVLLPNVTSTAAVAIVFGQLFGRDFGMINWLLDLVGIGRDRLDAPTGWPPGSPSPRWSTGGGPATTR